MNFTFPPAPLFNPISNPFLQLVADQLFKTIPIWNICPAFCPQHIVASDPLPRNLPYPYIDCSLSKPSLQMLKFLNNITVTILC